MEYYIHAHWEWKNTTIWFLNNLIEKVHINCNLGDNDPTWRVDDASFEKLGAMMSVNF